jgi:hypothetical protein
MEAIEREDLPLRERDDTRVRSWGLVKKQGQVGKLSVQDVAVIDQPNALRSPGCSLSTATSGKNLSLQQQE